MMRGLVLLLLLLMPNRAPAAEPCVWREGSGSAMADEVSPEEAQKAALARARYHAIKQGAGVSVSGATLVRDNILVTDLVSSMSEGFILGEEEPVWKSEFHVTAKGKPAVPSYTVKLKACVINDSRDRDSFFTLSLETNEPVYLPGKEITLTIRPSREAYVSIFHLDEKGSVTMLNPGVDQQGIKIGEGKNGMFPPEAFGLRATLSPGKQREAETFLAVATKERFDYVGLFGGRNRIPFARLLTELRKIPAAKRAIAMVPFEVREK